MEKRLSEAGVIACILVMIIAALVAGFWTGNDYAKSRFPEITDRTDTVTVRDSLPYYYPVPKDSAVIRYVTVNVPAHQVGVPDLPDNDPSIQDSVPVSVPIERRVYQEDSTYYAVVTGPAVGDLHPSLDTLKVYRETVTIETTRNITSYKAFRWSLGPFISQEAGLDYYAAKVGVQGDFSLGGSGRWRFAPEVGHYWMPGGVHDWYAGGRLRYDLIRKR